MEPAERKRILVEACCGSADDAAEAARGGADRAELNSNLFQGGLTPSVGTLEVTKENTVIPIMTMLRPRSGGFCYTDLEYRSMLADGHELLRHGADGIVFGCLKPDGTVDEKRMAVPCTRRKPITRFRTGPISPLCGAHWTEQIADPVYHRPVLLFIHGKGKR